MSVSGLLHLCLLCILVSTAIALNYHSKLISENFRHILTWEAGNETTIPAYYRVQYVNYKKKKIFSYSKECFNTTHLSCDLTEEFLDPRGQYSTKTEAFTENGTSVWVEYEKIFIPVHQTMLGPPAVRMTACNGCLVVTIQPPVCHLKSTDKLTFLSMVPDVYPELIYKVKLIKAEVMNESFRIREFLSDKGNFTTTILDLLPLTNYCISVNATAIINRNLHPKPSAWQCAVTALIREPGYPMPAMICGTLLTFGFFLMLVLVMLKWTPALNSYSRRHVSHTQYAEPVLLYPSQQKGNHSAPTGWSKIPTE
ncbi:interleukin-22 receptor subunit alpha-2-like [Rhinatrema bivittatum]|uniref:interleukin-22 receptor subunit alpha-2-like n=1 Tax=Rhinatrema bivittatum TaxID=194408 RepID=UPI001126F7D3|nr:interleukin-22 receptor subunit alpha-2-like [Rhinatrema bivittatum]XP_029459431.1 interleukin-22 receptor subunit alpha-2-like [Rhinatrema bivittatum]XP_029459432.1 interleukin-22 receptor subunit alpha-2-like [Rhinatrema bivittatum]